MSLCQVPPQRPALNGSAHAVSPRTRYSEPCWSSRLRPLALTPTRNRPLVTVTVRFFVGEATDAAPLAASATARYWYFPSCRLMVKGALPAEVSTPLAAVVHGVVPAYRHCSTTLRPGRAGTNVAVAGVPLPGAVTPVRVSVARWARVVTVRRGVSTRA